MDTSGIMPTYNVGGDGFGDGMGIWAFLIFALLLGGNGNFFGGNAGNSNAIQNDINRGFDNQNLQAQTRDILTAVTNGTAQTQATSNANTSNIINAIKDGNASLIREFGNVETSLTALGGNMQNCCCNILRATDQTNYNLAQGVASINANTTAQTQKILDAMAQNKIDDLQARINQLELQQATATTVKYPTTTSYCSGCNPFCNCGM